jgi:RNA polymerase sigma-70 factor (ECF subfamily)
VALKIDRSGEQDEHRVGGLGFDSLVDQYWEAVYRLVYHLSGRDVHDAQDLAQETFLKAIAARGSFKAGTNLKAWLLRIASNAFLDQRRRRKTAKAAPLEVEPAVSSPDAAEGGEVMAMVSAAINELDDLQRTVFLLRTQEDLSFREIATMLDTTEETARWHMLQARRKLMRKLEGRV